MASTFHTAGTVLWLRQKRFLHNNYAAEGKYWTILKDRPSDFSLAQFEANQVTPCVAQIEQAIGKDRRGPTASAYDLLAG